MTDTLRPQDTSFLFSIYIFAAITFLIAIPLTYVLPATYTLSAWLLLTLAAYAFRRVMLTKERYEFRDDRIIKHAGTPFTDSKADLAIKKITHVQLKKPWLRHHLFGTGIITIESAGGGGTEVTIADIDQPTEWYDHILDTMRANGYQLTKANLQYETNPAPLGVAFETIATTFGILIGAGYVASIITPFIGIVNAALTAITISLISAVFIYQNLRRRSYRIYDDTIEYDEGWFTKYTTVIPVEKLSDSYVQQGLVDKLFHLYDVGISSKGSTNDIHFKNIADGPRLEDVIDTIIGSNELDTYEQTKTGAPSEATTNITDVDTTTTRTFTPNGLRAITPALLSLTAIILLAGIALTIWQPTSISIIAAFILITTISTTINPILTWLFTTYNVKPTSITTKYDFITSDHTEFSFEKITGVVVNRNPFDLILGTVTIDLWSIGSDKTMTLNYVTPDDDLIQQLLNKKGLTYNNHLHSYDIDFNPGAFFLATLPVTTAALLTLAGITTFLPERITIAAGIITTLYVITITYRSIYYNLAQLDLYDDGIHCHRGIIYTTDYYVTLDDVKDITSTQYPFLDKGKLTFNIAGETVQQTKNGQYRQSYDFSMAYLPTVRDKHATIDDVLWNRPDTYQPTTETNDFPVNGKPAVKNYFVFWGLLLPLTILLIWLVPFLLWARLVKSYHISDTRTIERSGILYKQQTTLRHSKIDHIDTDKSLINKLCGNAKLTIQSIGSSKAELILRDLDNLTEFTNTLDQYY